MSEFTPSDPNLAPESDSPDLTADTRIEDVEKAQVGAYAEKPLRDIARDPYLSKTPEQKEAVEDLAERAGEEAMSEGRKIKEVAPLSENSMGLRIEKQYQVAATTRARENLARVQSESEDYLKKLKESPNYSQHPKQIEKSEKRRERLERAYAKTSQQEDKNLAGLAEISKEKGFKGMIWKARKGWQNFQLRRKIAKKAAPPPPTGGF